MHVTINPENPDDRQVSMVASVLKKGGVAIIPTDTIYALVCDIYSARAFEKVCRIKNVKPALANFSFLCDSLANISAFTRPFDRTTYKLLNKALPGKYTFILSAGSEVPVIFRSKKKTIGIRIPDHLFVQQLISAVGNPIMSTSLHSDDAILEYPTDPGEIYETFGNLVDCVVDGGYGHNTGSTVIDCTGEEPVIVREGAGDTSVL